MKKVLLVVIVLAIIGAGYYYYDHQKKVAQAPAVGNQAGTAVSNQETTGSSAPSASPATTAPATNKAGATFSSGSEADLGVDISVVEVDYDGSSFSPSTINIKAGDYVLFKNKSQVNFWPASNPHPTHTDYPGFDAKQQIGPGGRYQFQFTKVGSWGYHNHLNPSQGGTVVVTQ